jgi:RNA polymerase sigma-70 factor (ECF subfamily)
MLDTSLYSVSDQHLIDRINQRDQSALAELYDRYGAFVYAVAFRLTNDDLTAETVVMEVFQVAWQSVTSSHVADSVATWLLATTRYQSHMQMQPRFSSNGMAVERERQHGVVMASERLRLRVSLNAERLTIPFVKAALCALTAIQRRVIELAYYERLTQAEIATHLDSSLRTVQTEMRQGLMQLRELVVIDGPMEEPMAYLNP